MPEIPDAVIPGEGDDEPIGPVSPTSVRRRKKNEPEEVIVGEWRLVLESEPVGPPRPVAPDAGSMKIGPVKVSAKLSLMLIFWGVLLCNLALALGVIVAMLHRAGRL